jgi:hypothetical protein
MSDSGRVRDAGSATIATSMPHGIFWRRVFASWPAVMAGTCAWMREVHAQKKTFWCRCSQMKREAGIGIEPVWNRCGSVSGAVNVHGRKLVCSCVLAGSRLATRRSLPSILAAFTASRLFRGSSPPKPMRGSTGLWLRPSVNVDRRNCAPSGPCTLRGHWKAPSYGTTKWSMPPFRATYLLNREASRKALCRRSISA